MDSPAELLLRERLFAAVGATADRNGGFVSREELAALPLDGEVYRLIDQSRGIWNPRWLASTLSILSAHDGPYDDRETEGGLLRYAYRRGSSDGDNRKLRKAMDLGSPLLLLRKIATGVYAPVFPAYVVADHVDARYFDIALDESVKLLLDRGHLDDDQRRYARRVAQIRLHQAEFRALVIRAYSGRCGVCTLQHPELLDAAHIVPDSHVLGAPTIVNGLALCKIHHAAYDRNLLGISPDHVVRLSPSLLAESDGPMLRHGLQDMEGRTLAVPQAKAERPDPHRLELRYVEFLAAS
jgi:putative restriction endonuclease